MLDDDDEESFGDFTFAPPQQRQQQQNQTVHYSNLTKINGPDLPSTTKPYTNNDNDNDDDWGDFTFSHTLSLPRTSKPSDTFGFPLSDQTVNHKTDNDPVQPGSAPSRVGSMWERPKGVLPLSIFGEIEEEEVEESREVVGSSRLDYNGKVGMEMKSGGGMQKGVDLNELIGGLYKQSKMENGSVSDLNGMGLNQHGSGLVGGEGKKDLILERDSGWDQESMMLDSMQWNGANVNGNALNTVERGANSDSVVSNFGWNAMHLDPNRLNLSGNVLNLVVKEANLTMSKGAEDYGSGSDEDDDDGWEFQGSEAKINAGEDVLEINEMKTNNVPIPIMNGSDSSLSPLSSNVNGLEAKVNGLDSGAKWFTVGQVDESRKVSKEPKWGFTTDANPEFQVREENSKYVLMKTQKASNLNTNGFNASWNLMHSYSNGSSANANELSSAMKQLSSRVDGLDLGFANATGWGFNNAESDGYVNYKDVQIMTGNGPQLEISGANSSWNKLGWDAGGMNSNTNGVKVDGKLVNMLEVGEDEDFEDDDGWEFKFAEPETNARNGDAKGDKFTAQNSEEVAQTVEFNDAAPDATDLFDAPKGIPGSGNGNFGFDLEESSAMPNYTTTNTLSKSNESDIENKLDFSPAVGKAESVENSWAFGDACSRPESKDKANRADNPNRALPLSIFGEEEIEVGANGIHQDIFTQMAPFKEKDDINHPHSNLSVNDLVSTLYSQANKNTSVSCERNLDRIMSSSHDTTKDSGLVIDDDFGEDSWEFKDASSETRSEVQTLHIAFKECYPEHSTEVPLGDHLGFFSKLERELHLVVSLYLENLKKTQGDVAARNEDAEVHTLEKKMQDVNNELHQAGLIFKEILNMEHSKGDASLNEFCEVLLEPKYQIFDSHYQLSKKLLLVEKDPRSAVEPLKCVALIVKILKMVEEEQSIYVSAWSKMLSICFQELKHGSFIWNQSLQKNVNDQLLSNPQGQKYILALGEIFRVIVVLGASVELYKAWILVNCTDTSGIFSLLSECYAIWSSSGLDHALQSVSDRTSSNYNLSCSIIESIKHIKQLDLLTLYNHVFSGKDPICRLSGLTAGVVPGMETVVWDGEHYFVTLANLWANLISREPPNLLKSRKV